MRNKATGTIKNTVAAALIAALLTSCTAKAAPETETESVVPSSSVVVSSVSETTPETTEETSATSFTVETEPQTNPFAGYSDAEKYKGIVSIIAWTGDYREMGFYYGFDNPFTLEVLRNTVYRFTGAANSDATLSDVDYFQNNQLVIESYDGDRTFSDYMAENMGSPRRAEVVRAVLSTLGLRFGIDEIPASYLIERFPRFYHDQFIGTFCFDFEFTIEIEDPCVDNETYDIDLGYYDSIRDIQDDNLMDMILFNSCIAYNRWRTNCIYGHPYRGLCYGRIKQVREASTGRNVLVPSPEQALCIQADINSVQGCEDVDIFVEQTLEDFYAVYGYYPEELLNVRDNSVNAPANAQEYIDKLQSIGT